MDQYEQHQIECKKIKTSNKELLNDFAEWLRDSNLAARTIDRHIDNIDFYINEYLLYEDAVTAEDGIAAVGMFLGYWFIRKAMWASAASIKNNAASFKKFYTFLQVRGAVSKEDLSILKQTIKEEMPDWLATITRYDDPSITDMEEIWGL